MSKTKTDEYYVRLDEGNANIATVVSQNQVFAVNGQHANQHVVVVGQILANAPFEGLDLLPYPDEQKWHYDLCDR
jgi:hypothetical protein